MDAKRLANALSGLIGTKLAGELVADFIKIGQDLATKTLERASSGKFVETFVQCLQQIANGSYDQKPNVDEYLNRKAELESKLPEDLRICAARIARAMYTLRNKRNVAHKGQIDPNTIDLAFAHHGSSWIMAELLRNATGLSMQEAGELITLVHAPVGPLIEEIDGTHLVLAKVSVRVELLILLQSHYPSVLPVSEILKCLDRRNPRTVKVGIRRLYTEKLAHGTTEDGYRLTQTGHSAAVAEIRKLSENR
jgi:hypothetical protein